MNHNYKKIDKILLDIKSYSVNGVINKDNYEAIGLAYFTDIKALDEVINELEHHFITGDYKQIYILVNFHCAKMLYQNKASITKYDYGKMFSTEKFEENLKGDKDKVNDNFHIWAVSSLRYFKYKF